MDECNDLPTHQASMESTATFVEDPFRGSAEFENWDFESFLPSQLDIPEQNSFTETFPTAGQDMATQITQEQVIPQETQLLGAFQAYDTQFDQTSDIVNGTEAQFYTQNFSELGPDIDFNPNGFEVQDNVSQDSMPPAGGVTTNTAHPTHVNAHPMNLDQNPRGHEKAASLTGTNQLASSKYDSLEPRYADDEPIERPAYIPDILELLNPTVNNVDVDTHFSSVEEANEATRRKTAVPHDGTIPHQVIQKKAIVKALCKLVQNTDHAQDNPPMIKKFAGYDYDMQRIEAACWNVVENTMSRQTFGPFLDPNSSYAKRCKSKDDPPTNTFARRMSGIMQSVAEQKTICKHLLDPPYIQLLADDPYGAARRVVANKALNRRKGQIMVAGKQALEAAAKAESSTESEDGGDDRSDEEDKSEDEDEDEEKDDHNEDDNSDSDGGDSGNDDAGAAESAKANENSKPVKASSKRATPAAGAKSVRKSTSKSARETVTEPAAEITTQPSTITIEANTNATPKANTRARAKSATKIASEPIKKVNSSGRPRGRPRAATKTTTEVTLEANTKTRGRGRPRGTTKTAAETTAETTPKVSDTSASSKDATPVTPVMQQTAAVDISPVASGAMTESPAIIPNSSHNRSTNGAAPAINNGFVAVNPSGMSIEINSTPAASILGNTAASVPTVINDSFASDITGNILRQTTTDIPSEIVNGATNNMAGLVGVESPGNSIANFNPAFVSSGAVYEAMGSFYNNPFVPPVTPLAPTSISLTPYMPYRQPAQFASPTSVNQAVFAHQPTPVHQAMLVQQPAPVHRAMPVQQGIPVNNLNFDLNGVSYAYSRFPNAPMSYQNDGYMANTTPYSFPQAASGDIFGTPGATIDSVNDQNLLYSGYMDIQQPNQLYRAAMGEVGAQKRSSPDSGFDYSGAPTKRQH